MHARVNANVSLSVSLSFVPHAPHVSVCQRGTVRRFCLAHGGRIHQTNPPQSGSSSVRAAALIGRVHPPPRHPRARIVAGVGGGGASGERRRGRLGIPQAHASPLSSVYAIRYRSRVEALGDDRVRVTGIRGIGISGIGENNDVTGIIGFIMCLDKWSLFYEY